MRLRLVLITLALLFTSHSPTILTTIEHVQATSGRAGIDVYVSDIDIAYQNSADENKYKMFSSNHPISGFNRAANLFVVDGVSGIAMTVTITVSNSGTSDSSSFPTEVVVLHDEYIEFELHNTSFTFPNVPASGSSSTSFTWTPQYSGNHTIEIRLQNNNDDVYSNNIYTRHMTIAKHYDNCDDLSSWSVGNGWSSNSDTSISAGVSCHIGNGQTSTYGASWSTNLDMPMMDLSNAVSNPSRVVGISFFYTGSTQQGDALSIQARGMDGVWDELASLSGTIDGDFLDGTTNWQTFTVTSGSQVTPIVPMNSEYFHASSQIRFSFTSDTSGQDIGHWIDDIVLIVDEKAVEDEFEWRVGNPAESQARRGEWSDHSVRIFNDGNLSDRFIPTVQGLPSEWEVAFNHDTGSNVDVQNGVRVSPGESKDIRIRIKPGPNASIGNQSFTFSAHSIEYNTVQDSSFGNIRVLPNHIPLIIEQQSTPTCAAGNSCEFFIQVENIGDSGDIFDVTVTPFDIRQGWSIGLSWDQNSAVQISPGTPANIKFIVSVPEGEDPDVISAVTLEVASRSDPSSTDTSIVEAAAALVSNAEFGILELHVPNDGWKVEPGESITVRFTLWNNASRQDTFEFDLDVQGSRAWLVEVPEYPDLPINPGSSTVYSVTVSCPETAQAEDPGPVLIPRAQSIRSGMNASTFEFSELVVSTKHDLQIRNINTPSTIRPGNATAFEVEIENNGNGFDYAVISVPGLPINWHWWTVIDGMNYTGPIELTPSYELRDIAVVHLYILAPPEEVAGESLEFEIMVHSLEGEDSQPEDNSLSLEIITASVKRPSLTPPDSKEMSILTTGSIDFSFNVTNLGNIPDSELKIKALHSTNPPGGQVSVIVERIGGMQSVGSEWLTSSIQPGAIAQYIVTVETESDLPLGTVISVIITVVGGEDENGQPYLIEYDMKITADVRKRVDINLVSETIDSKIESTENHMFNLEFESFSSIDEYLTVQFRDSKLTCNGKEISGIYNLTIVKASGSSPTFDSLDCIIANDKTTTNEVFLEIEVFRSEESLFQRTISASWKDTKTVNDGILSLNEDTIYLGGAGIIIIVVVILLTLSRSKSEDEQDEQIQPQQMPQYVSSEQGYANTGLEPQDYSVDQSPTYSTQGIQPLPAGPPASTIEQRDTVLPASNYTDNSILESQSLTSATSILTPVSTYSEDKVYADGYSNSQLLNAGWTQDQIDAKYGASTQGNRTEQTLQNAFDSLGGLKAVESAHITEIENSVEISEGSSNNDPEGPTLPSVNCIVSGIVLTENHQWSQCSECGGWADATAKAQTGNCPRCRASW